jgi:hypothetical protein
MRLTLPTPVGAALPTPPVLPPLLPPNPPLLLLLLPLLPMMLMNHDHQLDVSTAAGLL